MESEIVAAALIVLSVLSIAGLLFVIAKLRSLPASDSVAQLAERLDSIARDLDEKLTQTRTDLAGRLQQAQGDLNLATADRLSQGFLNLNAALEQHLSAGRQEQANSLKLEIAALTTQTRDSIEGIRADVGDKLAAITNTVQVKLDQNIKDGFAQFEKVQNHLNEAQEQLKNLGVIGASINDLNNLLKMPHLRGRFGEQGLERLLEDFLPRHMYDLQASPGGEGAGRVDAIIKFPDRVLPIDAKFPREQVLALFDTNDPQAIDDARVEFERVMKEQAKRIAGYIRPEAGTTDMALMYLPSETLYMEAVRQRRSEQLAQPAPRVPGLAQHADRDAAIDPDGVQNVRVREGSRARDRGIEEGAGRVRTFRESVRDTRQVIVKSAGRVRGCEGPSDALSQSRHESDRRAGAGVGVSGAADESAGDRVAKSLS